MDTSDEFVEMCRKAEEIQKHWIISKGDFIKIPYDAFPEPWCESLGWNGFDKPSNGIWLPRQDQLQEMVNVEQAVHLTPFLDFIAWQDYARSRQVIIRNYSMEKLWLHFVMHEKYGKRWDGTDWVVE